MIQFCSCKKKAVEEVIEVPNEVVQWLMSTDETKNEEIRKSISNKNMANTSDTKLSISIKPPADKEQENPWGILGSEGSYRIKNTSSTKLVNAVELNPMYVFLASSLNVELVYCILKGITQFSYLTLADPIRYKDKLAKMHITELPG